MRTLIVASSFIAVPFLVAMSRPMSSAPFGAAAPITQPAVAGELTLDPVHSMALFRIQHLEAGQFWGRINALSGSVAWPMDDSAAPTIKAVAEIKHIDTGSEKLDNNLKGPNFFNEKEFPSISFSSTGGTRVAERHWMLSGDLSLHGVTKPVQVDCVVTGVGKGPTGKKVGFECMVTIKRSDFGMTWGIEKPPKALGDEVRLVIGLEADETKAE